MKTVALSFLLILLSAAHTVQASSPADANDKAFDDLDQAITKFVSIQENGTLSLHQDAQQNLSEGTFANLNSFVDILNLEVFEGRLDPITPKSFQTLRPTRYCECLLGCCHEGYCWIVWPSYISREPCQP